jgi:hypothetical protein
MRAKAQRHRTVIANREAVKQSRELRSDLLWIASPLRFRNDVRLK